MKRYNVTFVLLLPSNVTRVESSVLGETGLFLSFTEEVKLLDTMSELGLLCSAHPSYKVTVYRFRMCDFAQFLRTTGTVLKTLP